MSPHDPSLASLIGSMLEPNFLILVIYLSINLALAFKVIRVATKRYRQMKLKTKESGEFGVVEQPIVGDETNPVDLHNNLFRDVSGRGSRSRPKSTSKTDTPVADALVHIATWAFRKKAANAKRLVALLAIISLASTWYYMIAFLRQSYLEYIEQCRLTSYPLPPAPPPLSLSRLDLLVPAMHLRILRISQWLASLSLFKQAWMEVIKDNPSWWWSSEICIIIVGTWALFLRHEAARLRIPHVWTVMVLGQLVAISFAFNLFNLAVIYRLDTGQLLDLRCEKTIKPRRRIFEPTPEDDYWGDLSPDEATDSDSEQSDSRGPFHVAMSTHGPPHDPNVRVLSTTVKTQRKPVPPSPTFMDRVGQTMQRWIPEKIGLPLFVLAGMSSVLQHPNTFTKVMTMHLFPLLISLYPHTSSWRHDDDEKLPAQILFGAARVHPDGTVERPSTVKLNFGVEVSRSGTISKEWTTESSPGQVLRRMFARSQSHRNILQDPKMFYLGLGLASIGLRFWLSVVCFMDTNPNASMLRRLWDTVTLLFPTTFFRHSAQSSISSDHVCVALGAAVFVLLEGGLWLFNAALASPSAADTVTHQDYADKLPSSPGRPLMVPIEVLRIDEPDRKLIETQARFIAVLLALSPLLGGSATMSLYLAVRYTWVEQYRQHQLVEDFAFSFADNRGRDPYDTNVLEEREEVELIENEEGERYLEIREIKVRQLVPGVARAARAGFGVPSPPVDTPDEEEESHTSGRSEGSSVKQEGTQSQEQGSRQATRGRGRQSQSRTGDADPAATPSVEGSRRTTPLRQRHPPQRYQGGSP